MRRILLTFLALVLLGLAWIALRASDRPAWEPYARYWLPTSPHDSSGGITVTHLGVSTLLITDGATSLMTDGFFSRPSLFRVLLGRIEPDEDRIEAALERAHVGELAAVIVVHSHYDHVMDAPEVARRTGALLVGSRSTAQVGVGAGLPPERVRVARSGEPMRFGAFTVTLVRSAHFPHGFAMGEIETPLTPPARAMSYREGGSYSVVIEHALGNLLVQGSAGFVDGALEGYEVDAVLLGVGLLGTATEEYQRRYFHEIVETVGARTVLPIHYDDFGLPLEQPPIPFGRFFDDFESSMSFLIDRTSEAPGWNLGLLPAWEPVQLFPRR